MFEKLRRFISGRGAAAPNANSPSPAGSAITSPTDTRQTYVLLSRRFPEPGDDFPGFEEAYYCPSCHEYFVLAWHPRDSPLLTQCEVISATHPRLAGTDPVQSRVFCPKCGTDYAMMGLIQHPSRGRDVATHVEVFEVLDFPFPPHLTPSPLGGVKIGELELEKIVVFVSGEFPAEMDVQAFVYSGINELIIARNGGDLQIRESGGIRVHVLRVSHIVDETDWLVPLLRRHVFSTSDPGTLVFMTTGLVSLRPPMKQGLFCLFPGGDSSP